MHLSAARPVCLLAHQGRQVLNGENYRTVDLRSRKPHIGSRKMINVKRVTLQMSR